MEVEVEVDLDKGTVDFIFLKGSSDQGHERQSRRQCSDILTQPHREFVPYFEMCSNKDSIRWELKWWYAWKYEYICIHSPND